VLALQETCVTKREVCASDGGNGAVAGDGFERLRPRRLEPSLVGRADDRLG
jgi:hypothetical protein